MSNDLHNSIRSTIRRALYSTLGIPILVLPVAMAQQATNQVARATAEAPVKMEKSIVTGSLIPTAETVGSTPVQTVRVEDIQRAGTTDILSTLTKLSPGFTGGGNYLGQVNNNVILFGGQQVAGESFAALRNLPTLILLDGRRMVSSALSAAQGVDLNTVPLSMIERVEVLSDGASALYGSDAIGGVINIITKKDYNGVEIGGRVGFPTQKTSNNLLEYNASLVAGASSEHTRFVASAYYYHMDPLLSKDRKVASAGIQDLLNVGLLPPTYVSPSYPGRIDNFILAGSPFAVGAPGYRPGLNTPPIVSGGPFTSVAAYNTAAQAQLGYAPYLPLSTTVLGQQLNNLGVGGYPLLNTTDFGTFSILKQDRRNFMANFEHDLFDKKMTLFGSFLFANNLAEAQLAPSPVVSLVLYNIGVPANNPYNPFGIALGLDGAGSPRVRSRFVDSGNRIFDTITDAYRFIGGLRGELSENYSYEGAYSYSREDQSFLTHNAINGAALNRALIPNGQTNALGMPLSNLNDAAGNPLPVYNIFFGQIAPGNNAPETINQLRSTLYNTGTSELWSFDGYVNGTPFDLPAGKLAFAIGGAYNYESLDLAVDGLTQQGFVPGLNAASPFPGGVRDRYAGFIEVKIPVFSEDHSIPAFHSFEITAAGRYESINPGGDTQVPKVGARWQPLDKQVTLRGGYSQGFIAPSIFNLFGPDSVSNPQITLADGTGQVNIQQRANPQLKPSDSEQYNAGIVVSPDAVKGLTLSVDYYNVKQNHIAIADYTSQATSLNALGSASPFAPNFTFADGSRLTTTTPGQVLVGNWGNLIVPVTGAAAVKTDGLDLAMNYGYPLPDDWGKLTLAANANWILSYDFQSSPNLPYFSYVGQGTYNFGTAQGLTPDYNVNCSLAWEYKNFTYVISAHYIPPVTVPGGLHPSVIDPANPDQGSTVNGLAQQLDDYYTIDMQLSHEFGKGQPISNWYDGLRLTVGCRNITDNGAPFIAGATEDNTDKTFYDLLGRFVYFEIAKKF